MHHVAVAVAQHLKFNVPRTLDQLLDINIRAAECLLRFGARGLKRPASSLFLRTTRMPRPPPPSAALIISGKPISAAISLRRFLVGHDARASRNDRQPGGGHFGASAILFAHHANHVGRRTDKSDVRSLAHLGKIGVFGKKTVAGMDRVHVGDFRRADHLRNIQVALAAARRTDANGLIGEAHVQRIAVRLGINGDRANAQFLAGAQNAQSDFAAVGD